MSFGQQPPGGFYGPPGAPPGGAPPGGPPGGFGGPPPGSPPGGYGGPPGGYGQPPGGGYGGPPGGFGGPPGYVPPAGYGAPAPGVPPPMYGGGGTDTLAVVSLVLGILSIPLHFCCYLGWPVGIAAIICGIISIVRIGKEPHRYSGKGLAWGGVISAGLGFLLIILVFVLYGAAIMLSAP